jgi:hypothetical protein
MAEGVVGKPAFWAAANVTVPNAHPRTSVRTRRLRIDAAFVALPDKLFIVIPFL